jgi:hypothetical protein
LRAQLLLVQLPYSIEHLRSELEQLVSCLPEGSQKVLFTDTLVGISMPHTDIADVMAVKLRKPMEAFSNWWIVGLNGQIVCKNRSSDPFRHWMNKHLGINPGQPNEPQNVDRPQRRKIGLKSPVEDFVSRTFGEVPLKAASGSQRTKDAN